MGGIEVQVSEPVNALSAMLLARYGLPKGARPHALAAKAHAHMEPFTDHPSLAWLGEFADVKRLAPLYGHALKLAGPMSFVPRDVKIPDEVAAWETGRTADLPKHMAAFYDEAKLGTFARANTAGFAMMEAEVRDAVGSARIDEFLARLFGPVRGRHVVIPVPFHPIAGGSTGARLGADTIALLHPPEVPSPSDPVEWSFQPEVTQVAAVEAFVGEKLRRRLVEPDTFPVSAAAAFLRFTRGDEAAHRWLDDRERPGPIRDLRENFLAIGEFLDGRRGKDVRAILPAAA